MHELGPRTTPFPALPEEGLELAEARHEERCQDDGDEEQNGGNAELSVGDWGWVARFGTEHCDCLRCCSDATLDPRCEERIKQTSRLRYVIPPPDPPDPSKAAVARAISAELLPGRGPLSVGLRQNARVRSAKPTLPPAHGYKDDPATRQLLRSRPPPVALGWAGAALGGTVTSATPLRGGLWSAVHRLTVALPAGVVERVVLRRYVRPEVVANEPDIAEREARILRFLEDVDLPTPRLIAGDPAGVDTGTPTLLMSLLPGRVDWSPRHVGLWLRRLAEPLPLLHGTALPSDGTLPAFYGYAQRSYEPPPWARRPNVWTRAAQIFHARGLEDSVVCIHRDYHPGNVLWRAGRVSGLVDWPSASIGSPSVDVAHCRANLLGRFDLEVAERFTAIWEELTGNRFNPWADVMIIIGMLDGLRDDPHLNRASVEEALARAVASLGAGQV
jgi:phosphotransferase family enzyme